MKKKCRICSNKLITILNFKRVALSGSFIKKDQISKEKKYPLSVAVCKNCKHLQIQNLVRPQKLFNHYDWETGVSRSNIELIQSLLSSLKRDFNLRKKDKIFEIASNDGTLLEQVKNRYGNFVLGIDPAKNLLKISKKKTYYNDSRFFFIQKIQRN